MYRKNKVNSIVKKFLPYLKGRGIDLGCGQGREVKFLIKNGLKVDMVDVMPQMKEVICKNIADYSIEENKYDFILCLNVLQFLKKKDFKKVIREIKKIRKNGIIIISAFNRQDPSYKVKKFNYYLNTNELLDLFKDFDCLYYSDEIILDLEHDNPHNHGLSTIVVRKGKNK